MAQHMPTLPEKSLLIMDNMDILVDIGNTCLKWAIYNNQTLSGNHRIFYHNEKLDSSLKQQWSELQSPGRVIIACVADKSLLEEVIFYTNKLWPDATIRIAQTQSEAHGVKIAYLKAHKLGVDRWLGLIAARHYYTLPTCIVSCGTAVTVDVINEDGIHLGGMIAPGLRLMEQALKQGTTQLNYSLKSYKPGLGNDTEAGIYNGILFSIVGLISEVMNSISTDTQLIITGGDAERIADHIKRPLIMDKNMLFKGMTVLLDKQ